MSPTSKETERLVLRRWRAEDSEPFAALNGDPKVMEYFASALGRRVVHIQSVRRRLGGRDFHACSRNGAEVPPRSSMPNNHQPKTDQQKRGYLCSRPVRSRP